jgi:hypothetical protein
MAEPYIMIIVRFSDGKSTVQRIDRDKGSLDFNAIPALKEGIHVTGFSVYANASER